MKMKKAGDIAVLAVLAVVALLLWASGGIQSPGTSDGIVYDFGSGAEAEERDNKLVVLTWNIAYGYGKGSGDESYTPKSPEEMAASLNLIGDAIKDSNADIVLLQEVDFGSRRSHYVNQLEELSKMTGLRYAAKALSWKANYVPFPYWPPSRHFGRVRTGGAVLSRYPIISNTVTLHPKPENNTLFYNAFYLFRYSQHVRVETGDKVLSVINNHFEAFDSPSRESEANALAAIVAGIEGRALIIGGDMNTVPPEASVKHGFSDDDADYRGEHTISILRQMLGIKDIVDVEDYTHNEQAYFTFPSYAPSERLDYIFVSNDVHVLDVEVIQAGEMSDHLPVRAELAYSSG